MSERLSVDGQTISYQHREGTGDGRNVLVVHGATDHSWIWSNQLAALSDRHRLVVIDLPGRIGSDGPPIDNAAGFRAFIKGVTSAIGLEPFVFVVTLWVDRWHSTSRSTIRSRWMVS